MKKLRRDDQPSKAARQRQKRALYARAKASVLRDLQARVWTMIRELDTGHVLLDRARRRPGVTIGVHSPEQAAALLLARWKLIFGLSPRGRAHKLALEATTEALDEKLWNVKLEHREAYLCVLTATGALKKPLPSRALRGVRRWAKRAQCFASGPDFMSDAALD